eukprot:13030157-Alexandrium_andersonii.AAC.1
MHQTCPKVTEKQLKAPPHVSKAAFGVRRWRCLEQFPACREGAAALPHSSRARLSRRASTQAPPHPLAHVCAHHLRACRPAPS